MKSFLGMGLLGSNFVRAMRSKNIDVQVWNRSPAKAKALEQYGAKAFEHAADAVTGAETIHITLKDDASVDEVLGSIEQSLQPGAIIIDHTTTSKEGAIARTAAWKEKGFTYLHAPVFMGPPNALEGSGNMLVSGDQVVIAKVNDELSAMTGKLLNFGPEEGKAAAIKLLGNLFLIAFTAGLSDMMALAKVFGVPPGDLIDLFGSWNPGAGTAARLKRLSSGKYDEPSWELVMSRKDAGLMISAAEGGGEHLAVIPAIAAEMDIWITKGFGNYDWTVIAKDNLPNRKISRMYRVAFKMTLYPGFAEEYKNRHNQLWPDLEQALKQAGITDYSIFLDEETNALFGVLKAGDRKLLDELPANPIMQQWWAYMSDIMETNADNSPVSVSLTEVFHLA